MLSLLLLTLMTVPNFLFSQEQVFYAGCQEADFLLIEAEVVEVKTQGMNFVPKCLRVKAGTTVILPGSKNHPLQGSVEIDDLLNPFTALDPQTSAQTRLLSDVGQLGYHCVRHSDPETGTGMAGLIEVVE
jgi:plastocyanin